MKEIAELFNNIDAIGFRIASKGRTDENNALS
jgi:hypothetical protein